MSGRIVCIGGVAFDRKFMLQAPLVPGTSNPAAMRVTHGGVVRNVAETLARLGSDVTVISRVGADREGDDIVARLRECGVDVTGIVRDDALPTANYVAVLDQAGDLLHGLAAMQVIEAIDAPSSSAIKQAALLFADCNLSADALAAICAQSAKQGVLLAVDAVSTAKVRRLPEDLSAIGLLFLNGDEAGALTGSKVGTPRHAPEAFARLAQRGCRRCIITFGAAGLALFDGTQSRFIEVPTVEAVDVTGAGDALIAGTLFGLNHGIPIVAAASLGMQLAMRTIASQESIADDLSPQTGSDLLAASREG